MALSQILPSRLRVLKQEVQRDVRDILAAFRGPRRPKSIQRCPDSAATSTPEKTAKAYHNGNDRPLELHTIRFSRSRRELGCWAGETILETARRAGLDLSYSCTLGGCGACMLHLLEGEVSYEDESVICITEEERQSGMALACVGRPKGHIVVDA
jgi:ferredoxin